MNPTTIPSPGWIDIREEVAGALEAGEPVVALESAVITHGLPSPHNLETARTMEAEIRRHGAVPAAVAVLEGRVRLGLEAEELEQLARAEAAVKISRRDLAAATAGGWTGGTTVAGTMIVAHAAGVQVFATGGLGGVHRGASGDVSTDMTELARTPVAVVCSGAKAILDLPRTLEWLETAGVPVIGLGTAEFPGFYTATTGLPVSVSAATPEEAARLARTHWSIGLETGLVLAVPCPAEAAVPTELVEAALQRALEEAQTQGITGKAVTPFLLTQLAEQTEGATLEANRALLENNARRAAQIASALSGLTAH